MAKHLARRGGIWWARLVVPEPLRQRLGRREFVRSTRTSNLGVAKVVAAVLIAEWRQHILSVESAGMEETQALRLLQPVPALTIGGTISVAEAEAAGIEVAQIFRIAAAGRLRLYCRFANVAGHEIDPSRLEDDPATAGKDIPTPGQMPRDAVEVVHSGLFLIPDAQQLAHALLSEGNGAVAEIIAVHGLLPVPLTPT